MKPYLINGLAILLAYFLTVGGLAALLVGMTKDYPWTDWFKITAYGAVFILPMMLSLYNYFSYKWWRSEQRNESTFGKAGVLFAGFNGITAWVLIPHQPLGGIYDLVIFGGIIFLSGAMGGYLAIAHWFLLRDWLGGKL
jgi:hypothetical protein